MYRGTAWHKINGPFNSDMNDIFNQLISGMNGYNSETGVT